MGAFDDSLVGPVTDEDTDNRVLTRAKSNISPDGGGFHYGIQEVVLPSGIIATHVVWGETVKGSARDVLAMVEKTDNAEDGRPQLNTAKTLLHEELKGGARAARELIELAKNQLGISEKTLRRAQHELGIVASKAGFQGTWSWSFPFSLTAPRSCLIYAFAAPNGSVRPASIAGPMGRVVAFRRFMRQLLVHSPSVDHQRRQGKDGQR
jgi:hypothetical protein